MNRFCPHLFTIVVISCNAAASSPEDICSTIIDFANEIPDGLKREVTISISTVPPEGNSPHSVWGWSRHCEASGVPQGIAICDFVFRNFSAEFLIGTAAAAVNCLSNPPFTLPSGNLAILNFEIAVRTLDLAGVRDGTSIDVAFSRNGTTDILTISGSRKQN